MVKCPYCQHENQEGTLYCEQCKSDLAAAEAPDLAAPLEAMPVANIVEGIPVAAEPEEKLEPFAAFAEAIPVEAVPVPEPEREEAQAEPGEAPAARAPETAPAAPEPAAADKLPPDAKPRLVVLRGM